MQNLSFEQLLETARTLEPEQRSVLIHMLQFGDFTPPRELEEGDFAEVEVLNEAGAYSVFMPLDGLSTAHEGISDAELIAASQCISCEWEEEPI